MPYCPDNYDAWKKHDQQETDWLNSRPRCEHCGEAIQDEDLFDLEGTLYHIDCAMEEFKKKTEDYIEC